MAWKTYSTAPFIPLDVSRKRHNIRPYVQERQVPVVLAREQLLQAEAAGILCRDDTVKGLFFYTNLFRVA